MSVPVPLDELAAALGRRSNTAYLLTVGDEGRVHCVAAVLEWHDDELVVPVGATSARNAAARGHVVVLAPPTGGLSTASPTDSSPTGGASTGGASTGGASMDAYSLIVDADVTGVSGEGEAGGKGGAARRVRVRPSHAVFHRPAVAPDGTPKHDCVHVYGEAAPAG